MKKIDLLSKKIKEDLIFAGGTGQCVSVIKHKIKNDDQIFAFGDIDLKINAGKNTNIKKLKTSLIYFFINIINNTKDHDIYNI